MKARTLRILLVLFFLSLVLPLKADYAEQNFQNAFGISYTINVLFHPTIVPLALTNGNIVWAEDTNVIATNGILLPISLVPNTYIVTFGPAYTKLTINVLGQTTNIYTLLQLATNLPFAGTNIVNISGIPQTGVPDTWLVYGPTGLYEALNPVPSTITGNLYPSNVFNEQTNFTEEEIISNYQAFVSPSGDVTNSIMLGVLQTFSNNKQLTQEWTYTGAGFDGDLGFGNFFTPVISSNITSLLVPDFRFNESEYSASTSFVITNGTNFIPSFYNWTWLKVTNTSGGSITVKTPYISTWHTNWVGGVCSITNNAFFLCQSNASGMWIWWYPGDNTGPPGGGGGVTTNGGNQGWMFSQSNSATIWTQNAGALTNLQASQLQSLSLGQACQFFGYAGNGSVSGGGDTAIGFQAALNMGSATYETAEGYLALSNDVSGTQNSIIGAEAGQDLQDGSSNTAVGYLALGNGVHPNGNVAVGDRALELLVGHGSNNTALGWFALVNGNGLINDIGVGALAGSGYGTTESNNIVIGNQGTVGENGTIHIGTDNVQTNTFIAGVIHGNGAGLTNLPGGGALNINTNNLQNAVTNNDVNSRTISNKWTWVDGSVPGSNAQLSASGLTLVGGGLSVANGLTLLSNTTVTTLAYTNCWTNFFTQLQFQDGAGVFAPSATSAMSYSNLSLSVATNAYYVIATNNICFSNIQGLVANARNDVSMFIYSTNVTLNNGSGIALSFAGIGGTFGGPTLENINNGFGLIGYAPGNSSPQYSEIHLTCYGTNWQAPTAIWSFKPANAVGIYANSTQTETIGPTGETNTGNLTIYGNTASSGTTLLEDYFSQGIVDIGAGTFGWFYNGSEKTKFTTSSLGGGMGGGGFVFESLPLVVDSTAYFSWNPGLSGNVFWQPALTLPLTITSNVLVLSNMFSEWALTNSVASASSTMQISNTWPTTPGVGTNAQLTVKITEVQGISTDGSINFFTTNTVLVMFTNAPAVGYGVLASNDGNGVLIAGQAEFGCMGNNGISTFRADASATGWAISWPMASSTATRETVHGTWWWIK